MSDNISWLITGGYYGLSHIVGDRRALAAHNRSWQLVHQMCDKEIEEEMYKLVYSADTDRNKFDEIWTMIEEYKRDNPHLTWDHLYSFWRDVGVRRYPFTNLKYMMKTGKSRLNKSDEDMIRMYKYRVITLLMNMRGSYGVFEAHREVNKGPGSPDTGWTYQYG